MTRIAIIGGGPAGYEAALVASQHGATVTVIDRDGI
ncbi:FAD-dependent oxidoreductase, partial [Nocardia gipuzkoensis]